jgi:uncharacterized protein (TIGR02266 family)
MTASTSVTTKTVVIAGGATIGVDRFRAALEAAGHDVVAMTSAALLLDHVRTDVAQFDLLLLDLQLPPSAGIELVRSIRAIDGGRLPILIFSGTVVSAGQVRELAALGVCGYVNEHSEAQQILPSLAPHLFPDNFNRRGSPRAVLRIPIECGFGATVAAALTLNLGHGGVAVQTTAPLDNGAKISIRFRMPGSKREIDAEGRVAWSDRRIGMGIQFEQVDPASQAIIDNFVEAHFFSNRKA